MATVLCSADPTVGPTSVAVVAYGYSFILPLGICQSFAAFQNWFLNNTIITVPSADQGGWTDLFAAVGVTMGN
jgi:hypothetical protein